VAKQLDDQDESWHGGRPRHRLHCVRYGDPALPPPLKGAQQPPTFRPMSIVAKWSPISALVFIVIDLLIKKQLTEEITVLHPEQESALLTR